MKLRSLMAVAGLLLITIVAATGAKIAWGAIDNHAGEKILPMAINAVTQSATSAVDADECRHEGERSLDLPASASDRLVLTSGSGSLEVEGREGADRVRVMARLCASHAEYLEELDVTVERGNGDVELETHYPENLNGDSRYAYIDLVVSVPRGMRGQIADGSGSMALSGLGELRVQDGSGSMEISGVAGALSVQDGSGSIDISEVEGPVDIQDGSGSIGLRRVAGDVGIQDGSGSIDLREVIGSVEIADGSGSIAVSDVDGSVALSDGSGGIDVERITGNVLVRGDGSGGISAEQIGGDFRVAADGSGGISYSQVAGTVDIPEQD